MKRGHFLIILLIFILAASLFLQLNVSVQKSSLNNYLPNVFVGIDVAYDDIAGIKSLVDDISSYTNLLVIGSKGIASNATKLDDVCQYLIGKGLSFMIFTDNRTQPQGTALEKAPCKWGDNFLGLYAFDELGGQQIDLYKDRPVQTANNYSDAESQYVAQTQNKLSSIRYYYSGLENTPLFSSDYALYWFDYKAGYNAVFAEFGWNHSSQLNVALCRGAATSHNKEWGAMITWTYGTPPYIESGPDLYKDMVLAYDNGAKYIIIFDSDHNYTQNILKEEHLQAMNQFWQYTKNNPRTNSLPIERVAYVLPENYGYGFRGPNDKIWGVWEADNVTNRVCTSLSSAMLRYGSKLDIIYADETGAKSVVLYGKTVFWNEAF